MKTDFSAHVASRIWIVGLCLAIAGIAGLEVRVADSLSTRLGQAGAVQTDGPQAPTVDMSVLTFGRP